MEKLGKSSALAKYMKTLFGCEKYVKETSRLRHDARSNM